jgi:RHS repeat-associated protein
MGRTDLHDSQSRVDSDGVHINIRLFEGLVNCMFLVMWVSLLGEPDIPGLRFFIRDHLGSVRHVVNEHGAVLSTHEYSPYGEERSNGGAAIPFRFTGKEQDGFGLIEMGVRLYSAHLGRFLSKDPAALLAPKNESDDSHELDRYGYALKNPLKYNDPDGRRAEVTIVAHTIFVHADVLVRGNAGTEAFARRFVETVQRRWNNQGKGWELEIQGEAYHVQIWAEAAAMSKLSKKELRKRLPKANVINVHRNASTIRGKRSFVGGRHWDRGHWSAEENVVAHEFGHLLWLDDRYEERLSGDGQLVGIPDKGWEDSIMATLDGKIEGREIRDVISSVQAHQDLELKPWPGRPTGN